MVAPVSGGPVAPPNGWGGRPIKQLAVTTEAAGGESGEALTTQPVVEIRNALGVKIDSATDEVTAEVMSGDAILTGTTTVAAVAGVATFTDLELATRDGAPVQLMFRAVGAIPARGNDAIEVLPGVAVSMRIVTAPLGAVSGEVLATQPVIELLDYYGLRATGDDTTDVVASKKSGTGTLSGTGTVTAVDGLVEFTDLVMTTAGTYVLAFDSGTMDQIVSGTLTTAAS
jgi:hypothetical protein